MRLEHTSEQDARLTALDFDQQKAEFNLSRAQPDSLDRNLRLTTPEALIALAEKTGFHESPEMLALRNELAATEPSSAADIADQANTYLSLGEELLRQNPDIKAAFGLNVMMVVFYSPRNNHWMQEYFDEAFEDAFTIAEQNDDFESFDWLRDVFARK
jgi:hypothetical protein